MTAYLYADDSAVLYVDNTEALTVSSYTALGTKAISAASSLLAISIYNIGPGDTGVIMSLTYGGCITDTVSWKCTNTSYPNWNQIEYDDSTWPLAFSRQKNDATIFYGPKAQFSNNCPMISFTTAHLLQGYSYCRHWLN